MAQAMDGLSYLCGLDPDNAITLELAKRLTTVLRDAPPHHPLIDMRVLVIMLRTMLAAVPADIRTECIGAIRNLMDLPA